MPGKEEASAYIAAGIKVVPLHWIENGACTCRNGSSCPSAGKHPLGQFAPNGYHDATLDQAEVDRWPVEANLGIAPQGTLVCLDFDDAGAANFILDLIDTDGPEYYCAVKSRKGVHLWVRCVETPPTTLKGENGVKLGDVKANGLVAVPPSEHREGAYRWLTAPLYEGVPTINETAVDYAERLLQKGGIRLSQRQKGKTGWSGASGPIAPRVGKVADADIPFPLDPFTDLDLYHLNTGTQPTDDRSDTLFKFACCLWRAADERGVTLDPLAVAGNIRRVDSVAYGKYVWRGDAEDRYWEAAVDSRAAVDAENAKKAKKKGAAPSGAGSTPASGNATPSGGGTPPPGTPPPGGGTQTPPSNPNQFHYWWDPASGVFWFRPTKGKPVEVCNFEPKLIEVLNVWTGHEGEDNERESHWLVRFGEVTLMVGPAEMGEERTFKRHVQRGLMKFPHYLVHNWSHLSLGMREQSLGVPQRDAYMATGWLPGRDEFLLPACSVTADGHGEATFEDSGVNSPRFLLYGRGMDPHSDASKALGALLTSCPPIVVAPLLSQTLGAVFTSLTDQTWARSIVHLRGRTGSFKTTIAGLFMHLYGDFGKIHPYESWSSTPNALGLYLHRMRDLPAMVDDFKAIYYSRSELGAINRLIQNYADGTTRSRLNRESMEQRGHESRCLMVSTGEDVWSGQESASARTIEIPMPKPVGWEKPLSDATALQNALPAVGWEWIRWCCRIGQEALRAELHAHMKEASAEIEADTSTAHKRVLSAMASGKVYSRFIQRWVDDVYPEHSETLREIMEKGWAESVEQITSDAREAEDFAPFAYFTAMVSEAIAAGRACLLPRFEDDSIVGVQGSDPIGWADADNAYLNETLSFAWLRERLQRRGEALPFYWKGVRDGARLEGLEYNKVAKIRGKAGRYMIVPRYLLFGEKTVEESEMERQIRDLLNDDLFPDS